MLAKAISIGGVAKTLEQPMDELTLCRRIACGESHLFGQVVDQYSGLIAAAIAAQGVERSDIEDLAQTTLVNAYRGIAGFRGEARLSSWLYRIAINTARAHLKKNSRRLDQLSVEAAMESGQHPVDESAAAGYTAAIRNRALAGALGRLRDDQRTALMLYYMDEQSYEEIAAAMSMNINTVRTHIRRGKQRLCELLDESEMQDA